MEERSEIDAIRAVLEQFKKQGRVLLAYLFGSYAKGTSHGRSDIDIAIYIHTDNEREAIEIIDALLLAVDRPVEILRLDDEDESPFIVQESLKGVPLVEPDLETLYKVAHRALHEAESIRFRRTINARI